MPLWALTVAMAVAVAVAASGSDIDIEMAVKARLHQAGPDQSVVASPRLACETMKL